MIEPDDAVRVVEAIANDLISIANNKRNFEKLPDTFWGYFARGHDSINRKFGVIVTFSEKETDIDELIKMYEQWIEKQKQQKMKNSTSTSSWTQSLQADPLLKYQQASALTLNFDEWYSLSPFYFFGTTQVINIDPGPSWAMMT